jgi:pimeloyl-ACP methyl ester carboxylesterase
VDVDVISLPEGRDLELEVSGPDDGHVLLYIHGTPGGSYQLEPLARGAAERGHRLVTWSRAGYGASKRRPGRDVASEVADVEAVLDHVGADTAVVAGWSGGGPHALACGALLADRIRAVLCLASVGPYDVDGLDFMSGMGEENVEEFAATAEGEDVLRTYLEAQRPALLEVTGDQIVDELSTLLPDVDRAQLSGGFGDYLAATFRQGVAVSVDGWLDDDLAFATPWGFDVADIAVPTYLWQGSEDLMVPFAHGQWLAEQIPGVTAHLEPGEGHLSIMRGALDRWLDELTTHS